jgi:hypothetical protein
MWWQKEKSVLLSEIEPLAVHLITNPIKASLIVKD